MKYSALLFLLLQPKFQLRQFQHLPIALAVNKTLFTCRSLFTTLLQLQQFSSSTFLPATFQVFFTVKSSAFKTIKTVFADASLSLKPTSTITISSLFTVPLQLKQKFKHAFLLLQTKINCNCDFYTI